MKNFPVRFIVGMGLLVIGMQTVSAQWVHSNENDGDPFSIAVSGSNVFAVTYDNGAYLSTNNGTSWDSIGLTTAGNWAVAASGSDVFVGTLGNGIYLSTNSGGSWKTANSGLTNDTVRALAFSGNNIFAGTQGGAFLSTNTGSSWTPVNSGLTNIHVTSFAVSGNNLYAGTDGGVFLSTNNGTNWSKVSSGLTDTAVGVLAISGGNIFAGSGYAGKGMYLSKNNGTSWTSAGLTNDSVFAFAVSGSNVFAGTNNGVFLSANSGTSWTAVNTGLTDMDSTVHSLAVSGSNIIAGTNNNPEGSGGLWYRPLSQLGVGVIGNPQRAVLTQVNLRISSPSYINPKVTIEFSLPQPDHVTVSIYNLSGHEIASLVNSYLGQGSHSIPWNTRNLAAGCYTVRLRAGANTSVRSVPIFR